MKEDKIHGLRIGADDYLTKPYSIEELILKIKVFLKRSGKMSAIIVIHVISTLISLTLGCSFSIMRW